MSNERVPDAYDATMAPGEASSPARDARDWIVGRYELMGEIARGGMGRIVRAADHQLRRTVAIKQVLYRDPDLIARFEREALITARLQHPSIVPIHERGTLPSGEPYYVMKLVGGKPLDRLIDRGARVEERLKLLPTVIAVTEGIAYAHSQNIVHRDLKPGNVIVGEFGETVIIDWGLAKDLSLGGLEVASGPYRSGRPGETVAGAVLGTPAFMPPEQARGELVDQRSDVYALGALLYYLIDGRPPYHGRTAEEVLVKVMSEPPDEMLDGSPADLRSIVARAMSQHRDRRYATAAAMAEDLRRFSDGHNVGAHAYTGMERAGRWFRHRWMTASLVALLTGGLAIASAWVLRVSEQRDAQVEQVRRLRDHCSSRSVPEGPRER